MVEQELTGKELVTHKPKQTSYLAGINIDAIEVYFK